MGGHSESDSGAEEESIKTLVFCLPKNHVNVNVIAQCYVQVDEEITRQIIS